MFLEQHLQKQQAVRVDGKMHGQEGSLSTTTMHQKLLADALTGIPTGKDNAPLYIFSRRLHFLYCIS